VVLMKIRLFEPKDLNTIVNLYIGTVHEVNRKDYSDMHLNALAPKNKDYYSNWSDLLTANTTLLATKNQKIVGFGTLTHNGEIHFLYSHLDYQGKGAASALLQALEKTAMEADHKVLSVSTGITAKSFFIKKGYTLITEQYVSIDPMLFINYKMKKQL
jgi:putative acetyltransferase